MKTYKYTLSGRMKDCPLFGDRWVYIGDWSTQLELRRLMTRSPQFIEYKSTEYTDLPF